MIHLNETKKTFLLGLATGIAAISFTGFLIMTVAYFQKGVDSSEKAEDNAQADEADDNSNKPVAAQGQVDIKINKDDRISGDKNAPVTIIEFSDLQCPYCAKFHITMNQIMKDFRGRVSWVYRHFPLESIHPYAKKAALASECAGEQGKFWEYMNGLFANQSKINDSYLKETAKNLKLDTGKFNKCLDDEKYLSKVNNDIAEGKRVGVTGTPASFINGKMIKGAESYDTIKGMIEDSK